MNLGEAVAKLDQADRMYQDAKDREQMARKDSTKCLNALNEAQKAFDETVSKIRKSSTGGDWKKERGEQLSN